MKYVLLIWAIIWLFIGLMTFATSKSAIHEAVSGVAFVIATLSMGFFATIGSIESAASGLQKREPAQPLQDDTPIG